MTLTELPCGACGGRGVSGGFNHSIDPKTVAVFIHSGGNDVAVNKDARSRLCYRDASDRRNERSNATARATFRVGSTYQPTTFRSRRIILSAPSGEQWRVPRAKLRAFISPLSGGRMVANGGLLRLEGVVRMPGLTSRKSKRRFRVDSGTEASRHRRRRRRWRC